MVPYLILFIFHFGFHFNEELPINLHNMDYVLSLCFVFEGNASAGGVEIHGLPPASINMGNFFFLL